jgi:hypothetical protein
VTGDRERNRRQRQHQAQHRAVRAFQEDRLIVPPAGPGEGELTAGAGRPSEWTPRDAVRLGTLTGRVVLVCPVRTAQAWH